MQNSSAPSAFTTIARNARVECTTFSTLIDTPAKAKYLFDFNDHPRDAHVVETPTHFANTVTGQIIPKNHEFEFTICDFDLPHLPR